MKNKKELNFDIKQLRSFMEVLNQNSFTRASRKLKIGQATISHHINLLEEMLGVKLINRTSKELSITDEGKIFQSFCDKLLKDIELMEADLDNEKFGSIIKIAASTIPSTYILPKVIYKSKKEYPDIVCQVEISDSREVVEMVKERRAEIGIVGTEIKHPSLIYRPVCSDEIVLIGREEYPDRITIDDLQGLPFIVREFGSGTRKVYENFLIKHNIVPSDIRVVMECSTTESIKESVSSGIGVSFVSKLAIGKELRLGTLKIIDVEGLKIVRDFYLVYIKSRHISKQAKMLIDSLLEFGASCKL